MKLQSQKIKLTIKPNAHRLIITLGEKVSLFCSARYNFSLGKIHLAGIDILPESVNMNHEQDVFDILTDDAARLLSRLSRVKTFNASLSMAAPHIQTKWDTRVSFTAKDFEGEL